MLKLEDYLKQKSVVAETVPGSGEFLGGLTQRVASGQTLDIMYGETYDRYGCTMDSLKYYFSVAIVARLTNSQLNAVVRPVILVADIATCRNAPEKEHEELLALGNDRAKLVISLSSVFNLKLTPLLMSDYLESRDFQKCLEEVKALAKEDESVQQFIRQTVPESKVEIEEAKGFAYAFEEVASILEYDIKIGPPREHFYDEPARLVGRKLGRLPLQSIYLSPTYPLGFGFDFFFANPEIEEYGVTPYKAGSKGLQEHRVILGETSVTKIEELVNKTFVGTNPRIPNPILDLVVIGEMARQLLIDKLEPITIPEQFYKGDISIKELKELAINTIEQHILSQVYKLQI